MICPKTSDFVLMILLKGQSFNNPQTSDLWLCWKVKVSKILSFRICDVVKMSKFQQSWNFEFMIVFKGRSFKKTETSDLWCCWKVEVSKILKFRFCAVVKMSKILNCWIHDFVERSKFRKSWSFEFMILLKCRSFRNPELSNLGCC